LEYHIDSIIKEDDGLLWRFTGIYGESRSDKKENTWVTMHDLKAKFDLPWLCSGDFNEILFGCEKEGGSQRAKSNMQKFRMVLEDCDLHDLGFVGDPFTWRNNHCSATSFTKERLDRAVANSAWRSIFPLVKVTNGDPRHSDHRPIIIDVGRRECMAWGEQVEVLTKFEARWLEEEDCETKVVEAWRGAMEEGCDYIMAIQKKDLEELKEWDKSVLGELEKRIKKVRSVGYRY